MKLKLFSIDTLRNHGAFGRMFENASWLTGSKLVGDILHLLLFIFLSRYFGPSGIGQYAYGMAIAAFAFAVVNLGLEDYAIRECSRLPLKDRSSLIGQLVGIQLGIIMCGMIGLVVFSIITKSFTEKFTIILLLSAHQVAFALTRTLFAPAYAQQKMVGPAVAELLCRTGIVFSVLLMIFYLNTPLHISLIPFPLGGIMLLVTATMSARHHLKAFDLRLTMRNGLRIVRDAWPFATSIFLFTLRARVHFIIISFMLGDAATGIYASSLKFLEVGVMPLTFLGLAAFPKLSLLFEKDERSFMEAADKLLRVALILGALVAWALFFFVPIVVIPLLSPRFAPVTSVVKSMAILGVLMALSITVVRLLLAMHLQALQVKIFFWAVALNLMLTIALLPLFGIYSAVLASIGSMTVASITYLKVIQRNFMCNNLNKSVIFFFKMSLPAVMAGTICSFLTNSSWLSAVVSLGVFIGVIIGVGFVQLPRFEKIETV